MTSAFQKVLRVLTPSRDPGRRMPRPGRPERRRRQTCSSCCFLRSRRETEWALPSISGLIFNFSLAEKKVISMQSILRHVRIIVSSANTTRIRFQLARSFVSFSWVNVPYQKWTDELITLVGNDVLTWKLRVNSVIRHDRVIIDRGDGFTFWTREVLSKYIVCNSRM